MKRFQQLEQVQGKLEAMDETMQNSIDDAWENFQKTIDKNEKQEISNYMDNIREQRKELNAAIKSNRSKLICLNKDGEQLAEIYDGDLMLKSKIVWGDDLQAISNFLKIMMEEV